MFISLDRPEAYLCPFLQGNCRGKRCATFRIASAVNGYCGAGGRPEIPKELEAPPPEQPAEPRAPIRVERVTNQGHAHRQRRA